IGLFKGVVGKLQPILAQLPREFEAAALRRIEDREKVRHEAIRNVSEMVTAAETSAFDIDSVSDADLVAPKFPEPPYRPEDITRALRTPDLLPPGTRCDELDTGTFSISMPGEKEPARVTADPVVFDDYFESHQMVLPDGVIFNSLAGADTAEGDGDVGFEGTLSDLLGR
ncbi:hypothetical protein, partial [Cyanobium sp. Cruz-8H5]|uniref:hypothetical protein n=1 Tax=Cyanobium sp. Cruz-8H5 TaxID=2823712 RepID=UPI0020CC925F